MREITWPNGEIDNLRMFVDESKVEFTNGTAVTTVNVRNTEENSEGWCKAIIDENYRHIYSFADMRPSLCEKYNNRILEGSTIYRSGKNDFIVGIPITAGFDYTIFIARIEHNHIRVKDSEVTIISENIGDYTETEDKNIVITRSKDSDSYNMRLYNIAEGRYTSEAYDAIFTIDGKPNCFAVKKSVSSSTAESPKDDLCLTDTLYFQIDKDGNITSGVYSTAKLWFLNYDENINSYPELRRQELVEESRGFKSIVRELGINPKN